MTDPMGLGIKEAIAKYPKLEGLLNQYDIGCGPCPVGTCILKDVVSIHDLPPEDQATFLEKAEHIIQGEDVEIGDDSTDAPASPRKFSYSSPMTRLVHEHVYIKYVVYAIPKIADSFDIKDGKDRQMIEQCIDFIKNYADRYHHAKEEDILFKYFDESQEIIQVMYEDHRTGRGFVKNILQAIEETDQEKARKNLLSYHELLKDHIRREDEILYIWMDKELSAEQLSDMERKFKAVEARFAERPRLHEAFALSIAQNYA